MDDQGRKVIVCDNGTGVSFVKIKNRKMYSFIKDKTDSSLKNHQYYSS